MFAPTSRKEPASIRQHLLLRIALGLGVAALCVSAAGVLAARQAARARLDDRAATARTVFEQLRSASSSQGTARALHEATLASGAVRVSIGAAPEPAGTRDYTYMLGDGRRLAVAVSTRPIARATREALFTGLGIGAGVVLVLVSLLAVGIERGVAHPLARFADAIKRMGAGDPDARADERGPIELREAASSVNALLDEVAQHKELVSAAVAHDPLTGVTNSQQFHESLGVELKRAQRERSAVSLAILDLDGFGSINDVHGREFGDEVLQRVADELRAMMRATDLLARIGSDDFALVLPGTHSDLAFVIAERARKAVADASTDRCRISCSVGVASYPEDARDGSTLLQLASGALRWAKTSGRSQTRRYDPEHVALPSDHEERAEIAALLDREQPIVPFFQPLVALSTGRILGYEALSRFPEPPGRGPEAWFSQAARCGLGARLEAAALRVALGSEGRPAGTFLSINVSPATLGAAEVQAVLPEDMSGLVVEITEHDLADDLDALEQQLTALRGRGARIAIDDAGTGYSGLQQVMRIQPDVIKLDRSLVMNLHEDPAKEALIDAFVRFARRTGASVCAEGIETMEELKLLADLDVTYGQGYVLARPAPEWGTVSSFVSESLLRSSLRSQGDLKDRDQLSESGDQRLEYVSARLSKIHAVDDLDEVFELIGAELGANAVCLSRWVRSENVVETVLDTSGDQFGTRFNLGNYPSTLHVLHTGEAVQVLTSDPGGDLGELSLLERLGYHSLLMVPVVSRGERLGLLEAYSRQERPWTRSEINRARIISYQLGAVLDGLEQLQGARLLADVAAAGDGDQAASSS